MPNVTSLNAPELLRILDEMQNQIQAICERTQQYVIAFESAQERCSPQQWMTDTIDIGNGVSQLGHTLQVAIAEDMIPGIRKFEAQLQDFGGSGMHVDA